MHTHVAEALVHPYVLVHSEGKYDIGRNTVFAKIIYTVKFKISLF